MKSLFQDNRREQEHGVGGEQVYRGVCLHLKDLCMCSQVPPTPPKDIVELNKLHTFLSRTSWSVWVFFSLQTKETGGHIDQVVRQIIAWLSY